MYYIVYALLYLVSLIPFTVMYGLSNGIAWLMFNVFSYRKDVVLNNLRIAFPEKSTSDRKKIAIAFYRNLIDTFLESIKLISMSNQQLEKRINVSNMEACNQLIREGKNVQFHSGHQFNWEYANLAFSKNIEGTFLGVYMPIKNKVLDRLFLKIRSRYHTTLIPVPEFKDTFKQFSEKPYSLALVSDQNPGKPMNGHWLNFFGKPTPFVAGPDKGARLKGTAVVFVKFVKGHKRGYYTYKATVVTENASDMREGELTLRFRDFLEDAIREHPDNYLWSHRRWRRKYKPEYEKRWIEPVPPPIPT
ncbi:MAG TPA: lipid A biosynthesis acyltransferase [Ferruginibacter sp.]|nr:lipid A biosynthesis acyltransferase [Ferruginibacter sp.]HRO05164.1 lipid A biosynthesis acyltransferase [Ferruginibacter sp.]HRO95531.1 lipid A biosynthesis acyltransferase [Ferruginibacter sp.]HRP50256.1 lipid A biosynthesis acyltransferase [Ferruginibacter sp.]